MQRFELVIAIVADDEDQIAELLAEAVRHYTGHPDEREGDRAEPDCGWTWRLYDHERREQLPRDLR